ncbi:MAG TPA: arsenate reductase (glutaredoxin) [Gammaproteobacteria bacterium]|nr:arsenate reductase (glutaredoxin) [Gammaproteobacteria bacterium]
MTDTIRIFHNPRCSKSRATMALLSERDIQPDVVDYLIHPPGKKALEDILDMLGLEPRQLMRTHEVEYKNNNLADESLSRQHLIEAMIKFPVLIERPIVIHNGKAAIGRPPENILEIL